MTSADKPTPALRHLADGPWLLTLIDDYSLPPHVERRLWAVAAKLVAMEPEVLRGDAGMTNEFRRPLVDKRGEAPEGRAPADEYDYSKPQHQTWSETGEWSNVCHPHEQLDGFTLQLMTRNGTFMRGTLVKTEPSPFTGSPWLIQNASGLVWRLRDFRQWRVVLPLYRENIEHQGAFMAWTEEERDAQRRANPHRYGPWPAMPALDEMDSELYK